jgi:anti-sigma regulatory factor (Ser/Thr protein kinase)
MARVALRFRPAAEHVRLARLVAVAVGRRSGMDEERLDEVRLAVGEACARAVARSADAGIGSAVEVTIEDAVGLEITVTDGTGAAPGEPERFAMALIRGLADEVHLESGPGGRDGRLRMCWSAWRPEPD